MKISYLPLPTNQVRALQHGGKDADGNLPERQKSDGDGNSCRHCLGEIAEGDELLIVSHRPFSTIQPYAEQGPIFLHGKDCDAYGKSEELPEMYKSRDGILLRGYNQQERIVYGTGQTVKPENVESAAWEILQAKDVAYVHARSATNNCYQFRIEAMK